MAERRPITSAAAPGDEDAYVVLVNEDKNEKEFLIVTTMYIAGRKYLLLEAAGPGDADLAILRVDTDPVTGEAILADIEDDEEFRRVAIAGDAVLDGYDYCRGCGCTDTNACEGGCSWVSPGLCSACANKAGEGLDKADVALVAKMTEGRRITLDQAVMIAQLVAGREHLAAAAVNRIDNGEKWATVYGELARACVGKEGAGGQ